MKMPNTDMKTVLTYRSHEFSEWSNREFPDMTAALKGAIQLDNMGFEVFSVRLAIPEGEPDDIFESETLSCFYVDTLKSI